MVIWYIYTLSSHFTLACACGQGKTSALFSFTTKSDGGILLTNTERSSLISFVFGSIRVDLRYKVRVDLRAIPITFARGDLAYVSIDCR